MPTPAAATTTSSRAVLAVLFIFLACGLAFWARSRSLAPPYAPLAEDSAERSVELARPAITPRAPRSPLSRARLPPLPPGAAAGLVLGAGTVVASPEAAARLKFVAPAERMVAKGEIGAVAPPPVWEEDGWDLDDDDVLGDADTRSDSKPAGGAIRPVSTRPVDKAAGGAELAHGSDSDWDA